MAEIKMTKNIFTGEQEEFELKEVKTVEQVIREHSTGKEYEETVLECYDVETGKTFYKHIEQDTTCNVIIFVNKQEMSLDYEIQPEDTVVIVFSPCGGSAPSWLTPVVGALGVVTIAVGAVVFVANPFAGALLMIAGACMLGGLALADLMQKGDAKVGTSESGLEGKKLPDVNGAKNQSIVGNVIPTVIGKHLATPFIAGSPNNTYLSSVPTVQRGDISYQQSLFIVGYSPLRISDLKLGDILLAHNQSWTNHKSMKNIFHGKLSGTEIYEVIDPYYQSKTTIDLANRPIIPESDLLAAGWEEATGSGYATVYSASYSNEPTNNKCVLVTPILDDGTILSPAQLEAYANRLLNNETIEVNILLATFTGSNCIAEAEEYAVGLHENQEAFYFSEDVSGDITNKWANNDVSVEILQQGQNGEAVDYGTIYPYAKLQRKVDANVLYINDGTLNEGDLAEYKGISAANGLRTNTIKFTDQCPKKVSVMLDAPSGLYKTRTESDDDNNSRVRYYRIPLWLAVQWRVYSESNEASDGKESGVFTEYWNPANKSYGTQRSWHSFETINGVAVSQYTAAERNADIQAHTGNELNPSNVNAGWLNAQVFNLQPFGGTNDDEAGISEMRFSTTVDLEAWARANLKAPNDTEEEFIEKFKAYFLDGSNTMKSLEIRVVRVSPCYMSERTSSGKNSAFNFNDIVNWKYCVTEPFDEEILNKEGRIEQLRPIPEEIMRKCCVIALKAKVDSYDQISGVLNKFTCVAQSFSPYYDKETKRWIPENVKKIEKYYKPCVTLPNGEIVSGEEITKEQFEQDRQNGIKSEKVRKGNDFVKNLVTNEIRIAANVDSKGRYYIPNSLLPYCGNNVASMFLLGGIGVHNGVDALGYIQSDFEHNGIGDFDLISLARWSVFAEDVTDGSTYPTDGYHYTHDGVRVRHLAGEVVHVYFAANAYIYQAMKLETMLSHIAVAGRAGFTYDPKDNRIKIIVDKPEPYPVALINQQNTLESTYTISFQENPSGIQYTYPDENDGYNKNVLYCMADGENAKNPKRAIETLEFKFVTNNYQIWSLGRYVLASRLLNKEVVTKKLGAEGLSIGLGNVVLLQDDTMLIGTDTGGRITRILEDQTHIYGFLINNTYHYTGETEVVTDNNGNPVLDENDNEILQCKCGVVVMQPNKYKSARLVTLRLAMNGTSRTIRAEIGKDENGNPIYEEREYSLEKGNTNVVLFAVPVSKVENPTDGSEYYNFEPAIENIVGFGYIGKVTAPYRVLKIKRDEKYHFTFTLMKYQKELYEYGRKLPSFQNNMTIPDRSGEDNFGLSENVNGKNLNEALANAQKTIISSMRVTPSTPTNLSAKTTRDSIRMSCAVSAEDVNNIDYVLYEITKEDGTVYTIKDKYSATYLFDRQVDGYPESENLSHWSFRTKAVSVYTGLESEWSQSYSMASSLGSYGTWHIPQVVVQKDIVDRTVILSIAHMDSGREVYGTATPIIKIRRVGNKDLAKEGMNFNSYFGVSEDDIFYTPEFNRSVQYTENGDNEGNYKEPCEKVTEMPLVAVEGTVVYWNGETTSSYTNGKYYKYVSGNWVETKIGFKSYSDKISHTLPLLGQTERLFTSNDVFTGTLTKDAQDVTLLPESPAENLVIHYKGVVSADFKYGKYYMWNGSSWEEVVSRCYIVPTVYEYAISMTNESGFETPDTFVEAVTQSTNIADFVRSHEHYKELYVEKLSAISANVGLIKQGGFGSFNEMENCWALTDLTAEESGTTNGVMKGTFRVGDNNEYFRVTPYLDENNNRKFKIELKAGNIELTTDTNEGSSLDFTNGTFIYNADRSARLKLTSEGSFAQKRKVTAVTPVGTENPKESGWYELSEGKYILTNDTAVAQGKTYYEIDWEAISKFYADSKSNLIITNSQNLPPFGNQVTGTVYHFDDAEHPENEEAETPTNPKNISCTGTVERIDNLDPMIIPESSPNCLKGTVNVPIDNFTGDIVFLSKANLVSVDTKTIGAGGDVDTGVAAEYNELVQADSSAVGLAMGLTQTQIDSNIFKE